MLSTFMLALRLSLLRRKQKRRRKLSITTITMFVVKLVEISLKLNVNGGRIGLLYSTVLLNVMSRILEGNITLVKSTILLL